MFMFIDLQHTFKYCKVNCYFLNKCKKLVNKPKIIFCCCYNCMVEAKGDVLSVSNPFHCTHFMSLQDNIMLHLIAYNMNLCCPSLRAS